MAASQNYRGVFYGLGAALLFGVSTPLAKTLVGSVSPLLLAGLLYAGAGVGLTVFLALRHVVAPQRLAVPSSSDTPWLAGAIALGGVAGPIALMYGLTTTSAASASLLLNLEAVFTALLAWFLFRENFDSRIASGMVAIVLGGVVLAWSPVSPQDLVGLGLIALACLCWAMDNNLTRKVSANDAVGIAAAKGLVAGAVNIALAIGLGHHLPRLPIATAAATVGLFGYGVSLVLFILALRELGTARAGAYFSVAPFFGATIAIAVQGEPMTWHLALAGLLMATGVWLHVSERHAHAHTHEALHHTHAHRHDDDHHSHQHDFPWDEREPHVHPHAHETLTHTHTHYPDSHHRHLH